MTNTDVTPYRHRLLALRARLQGDMTQLEEGALNKDHNKTTSMPNDMAAIAVNVAVHRRGMIAGIASRTAGRTVSEGRVILPCVANSCPECLSRPNWGVAPRPPFLLSYARDILNHW